MAGRRAPSGKWIPDRDLVYLPYRLYIGCFCQSDISCVSSLSEGQTSHFCFKGGLIILAMHSVTLLRERERRFSYTFGLGRIYLAERQVTLLRVD